MATQQTVVEQKRVSTRTIILIGAVVLLTVFAVMNWKSVPVWPLDHKPMTLVIFISFVLGAVIGWLGKSIFTPRRFVIQDRDNA